MPTQDDRAKLTSIEIEALQATWNLSDAHTHQTPSRYEQISIIDRLPDKYAEASRIKQSVADMQVASAYHRLAGQGTVDISRSMLCYSSSQALEIVANFLRLRGLSRIALLEPTFDNIPDILRRQGSSLIPVRLAGDWVQRMEEVILSGDAGAVMLVAPNNPTGDVIDRQATEKIAALAAQRDVILIVDASFRLFDSRACYDSYEVLDGAHVPYAVIEDTGKIWPTLDMKVAFINCSADLLREISDIHRDFLLNVSPLICLLVAEFCRSSMDDNLSSVRDLIAGNRQNLKDAICDSGLAGSSNPGSRVSVEFLRLRKEISSEKVARYLSMRHGVWTLPGSRFFWAGTEGLADSYLRVALSRDREYFSGAVAALAAGLHLAYRSEL